VEGMAKGFRRMKVGRKDKIYFKHITVQNKRSPFLCGVFGRLTRLGDIDYLGTSYYSEI